MKLWIKRTLVGVWGKLCTVPPSQRALVLCYHSVHPTKTFASVTPPVFDSHLAWLTRNCQVVPFRDILRPAAGGEAPRVAITFDDGYADNFEHAFPHLLQHGVPFTIFLTAGLLLRDQAVVDRFRALRACDAEGVRPLGWEQVRIMTQHGGEVGSHTYSHPNLALLSRAAAARELRLSKQVLETHLGLEVPLFAYPFGRPRQHFTRETVGLVAEAGYRQAAAVLCRGVRPEESPLRVPRFCVARDDVASLSQKIAGAWDIIGLWQNCVPLSVARIVSPDNPEASRVGIALS